MTKYRELSVDMLREMVKSNILMSGHTADNCPDIALDEIADRAKGKETIFSDQIIYDVIRDDRDKWKDKYNEAEKERLKLVGENMRSKITVNDVIKRLTIENTEIIEVKNYWKALADSRPSTFEDVVDRFMGYGSSKEVLCRAKQEYESKYPPPTKEEEDPMATVEQYVRDLQLKGLYNAWAKIKEKLNDA